MCPMMRCRCRLDDIPTTLNHISGCPWIGDGWYWCPFCCRPENFFESTNYGGTGRPRPEWTGKPLKRRMAIFRHLIHLLMPRTTVSLHAPTELDASLLARTQGAEHLDSTPELESIAHVVELPAKDPQWYYPEASAFECLELEASAHHLPNSHSAEHSLSTGLHSALQNVYQTTENMKNLQMQIAELPEVSRIPCNEKHRLMVDSSVLDIYCKASPDLLIEKGILRTKELINRKVLKSFEDVFAMTSVFYAIAYLIHHDDRSCGWNLIIWDLHHWQQSVKEKLGPRIFLDAVDPWNVSKECPPASSSRASFSSKYPKGSTRDQLRS